MQEYETIASSSEMEVATLGGGCFWCLEPLFEVLLAFSANNIYRS